ncbi:MAG: molybdopterin-guanine dinucleotide biosynthesis protein MobB, partial [Candidatus Thermoplasmatota archaeon]|nr:molybdopterin-guanine dinucleotide biosynthesis protein MobB [Candidatus Thermoplasmatota archaeon]
HQDLDSDGKDSHRYVEAGAETALVCGDGRSLVSISHRMEIDETKRLINLLGNHDLIIFESFRDAGIPKIRLGDGDVEDGTVLDNPSPEEAISFIEGKMRDAIQPMVYLDGKKIPLGEYPGLALETTIRALVSTLKGAENGMEGRLEIILGKKG